MKLLLLDDDPDITGYVTRLLGADGHQVDATSLGCDALFLGKCTSYDAMIFDRQLPDCDGLDVLRELRSVGVPTPVMILSSLGAHGDRSEARAAGAADYLLKPFTGAEFLARIQCLGGARRPGVVDAPIMVADLEIDRRAGEVRRSGLSIALSSQEYRILEFLAKHAGQVVTKSMILERVFGIYFVPASNVVESYMNRLHSKIEGGARCPIIRSIRNIGYSIELAN